MNSVDITKTWFPNYAPNAPLPSTVDTFYDDFDAQSERLLGHDQEYLQLSSGPFYGRFHSTSLGSDVSIHIEVANQSLDQWTCGAEETISIGVVLSEANGFVANGKSLGRDDILFVAPGKELNLRSPADGVIMAICFDKDRLKMALDKDVSPNLSDAILKGVGNIRAPHLAARIREDVFWALDLLSSSASPGSAFLDEAAIGSALFQSISAQLSLHNAVFKPEQQPKSLDNYAVFAEACRVIRQQTESAIDYPALSRELGCSVRSIQLAFSRNNQLSPFAYSRLVKLHLARREIISGHSQGDSIGDIAARFGFWNWSRFSSHYKQQFGELPSQTRKLV